MIPLTKKDARVRAREEWRRFFELCTDDASGPMHEILGHLTVHLRSRLQTKSRLLVSIALADEPDYLPLLRNFTQPVYAPLTLPEGRMEFRLIQRGGRLLSEPVPGHMNIPGPPSDAELLTEPLTAADIALIPSLAAGPDGRRLGRGGGYYDRWKNKLIPAHKIALLPETLTNLAFPAEEHDLRLDGIISPDGFIDLNPGT